MRRNGALLRLLGLLMLAALAAAQTSGSSQAPPTPSPSATNNNPPPGSSESSPPPATATASSAAASSRASSSPATSSARRPGSGTTSSPAPAASGPPDVHLRVPELHVGRIELDVDDLQAELNLNAQIANLVTLNAGVSVGVSKVNITIADVDAEVDLVIRLGHLAQMVNRTLHSLDLNPLLINLLNDVGEVVTGVVGAVDGLLGSIVRGDSTVNLLIDNLGNIVQEVVGAAGDVVSSVVGNYQQNMTFTGIAKDLGNGLTQKTYRYDPLGMLVNIVFNTLGQIVQAVVVGKDTGNNGGGGGGSSSSSALPTAATSAATKPPSSTASA